VVFTQTPLHVCAVTTAIFDDTCGNLIQLLPTPPENLGRGWPMQRAALHSRFGDPK
jgi:hypothetical protein